MNKYVSMLIVVFAISIYPAQNNKIEIGGFGVLSGVGNVGFLIVRPVLRYYLTNWFFVSPNYNYKYSEFFEDNNNEPDIKTCSESSFGLGFGTNLKPNKYFSISLSTAALSQYVKSNYEYPPRNKNDFALYADANLKYYIHGNLTIGLLYYLSADIANGSQYPDAGILIGFTYYIF